MTGHGDAAAQASIDAQSIAQTWAQDILDDIAAGHASPGWIQDTLNAIADDVLRAARPHLATGLLPAERLAITVARAQIERGENPPINTTAVLLMAIDRLTAATGGDPS